MISRVLAVSVFWLSSGWLTAFGQTDITPPSVPTGLAASVVTVNSFTITWSPSTDNIGVTGYEVFKGNVSLGSTAALTLNVTGLSPNTAYAMKVRARDAAGKWSAQSLALSVKTLADTAPPAIPTGLAVSLPTATGLTLTWSAAADNVATTGYEVFKNGVTLGATSATTLTKTLTGLAPLTVYVLTVRARDVAGNWSAQSSALSVTTLPDTTAPAVPGGLNASLLTATTFTLKWTAATDNVRVTSYEVFRDGVSLGLTTATSRAFSTLAPATVYALTVRSRDAAGNLSAASAALSVITPPDTTAPSVPVVLTPSSVTISGFLFRWNAVTDNVATTAYEVFRDGVSQGLVAAPATSLNLTGLALASPYIMTVRARDAAGNWSALSAPRTVTTLADTTPPTVPAALVATAVTINSFTLSWNASTDNVGVTAYEVFRGNVSLGFVAAPALTLYLTALSPNTGYSMRVRARDAAGKWSAQSVAFVVRTLPDTTPPAVPTGLLSSSATVTGLTLTWSAATDDVAVTAYEIFRNGVSLGTTAALSKTLTGLTPDTAYTFTVRARDAAANWSEQSAALTVSTLPDATAPTVPTGLNAASVNVSTFTLKWAAATDDVRVTGYEIFKAGVSLGVTTALSKNITGLVPATAYVFTVRARDGAGNWSVPSAALAVSTLPDTTPPAVPTGLVASVITGSSFTLRWTAPKDDVHVTTYEIFKDGVSLGLTTTAIKTLTGLYPETEYALTVRASDAAGNWSAQSLALPVTTLADTTAPSVPTGLVSGAVTVTGFTLTWTASTDGIGVTLYEIFQDNVSVGTTATTTYTLTGLTPATTYLLKIRASDVAGNWSAPSAAKSVKTAVDSVAPTVPDGLIAGAISGTAFTLSWNPSTDNAAVTAYEVFRGSVSLGTTDTTSMVINGLTLGSTYALKVRARDAKGNWSASSTALSVTTYNDTTPPTVPVALAAADVGLNSFTLTWAASIDDVAVTAYEIFKDGASLGTSAISSFNVANLALNTTCVMTVRARDANANTSALSAPLTVSTAPDTVAPSVPQNVASGNLTPTGFTVSWSASSDDVGVTAYEVFVNGIAQGLVVPPATTFTLTTLPPPDPAYVVTIRARDAAGNWSAQSDPLTLTINLLPYVTGFEPADGYQLGSLHGQQGWSVDGSAAIVTTPVYRGVQAVAVAPLANLSLVTRQFANTNPGITFVDVFARPAAADNPDTGTFLETDTAAVALTQANGASLIQFFNGNGTGGGEWLSAGTGPALDANGQVITWQRITLRTDYAAKRWDLYLNGRLIAAALGFLDDTANHFTTLSLDGHATLATGFDDVFVGFENPLFADADKDGMDDAWELAHGLNPAVNDRDGDLDGDGVSNLREYLAGTAPEISNIETDSDGDGLPDAWELQYLGTLNYGASADPGGAGRTLFQSYQQNLSPLGTPFATTGLRLWLRADVSVQTDANGFVSTWADLSGQHNDASQGNPGVQPRLISGAVGGQPAVRFDGEDDFLDIAPFMAGAAAGELFAIVKVPAFAARYDGLWALGGADGALTELRDGIYTFTEDFGRTVRGPTGAPITSPTDYLIYNVSADATTWNLRLNGFVQSAAASSGVAFNLTPVLGRGAAGFHLQGDIAEVIAYDRVLSESERVSAQSYLATKYGLTASLPQPPPAPTLSALVATPRSIALSWPAAPTGQSTVTIIERQEGSGDFVEIASVTDAVSYTDTALMFGSTYAYRAKTANSVAVSDYGNSVVVTLSALTGNLPTDGQRLWLRADLGVATDATGAVSTWYDQSGGQKNATQLNAVARPLLVPAATNGQSALRFDGTSSYLDLPAFMAGASAGDLFVIVKIPDFATRLDGLWSLGGADGALTESRDGVRTFTEDFGRTVRDPTGAPVMPPTDYLIYNVSADAATWTLRLNGMAQSTVGQTEVAFSTAPVLGRGAAGYFLQGDIAEVIVYDRTLTDAEREQINRYLGEKFGIAAFLADVTPPSVPTDLTASDLGARGFTLSWTPSNDDRGVVAYTVLANGITLGRLNAAQFTVMSLNLEKSYEMTVFAEDAAGNVSPSSVPLTVVTLPSVTAPNITSVTGLSATGFTLSWRPSAGVVVAYDIFRDGILIGSTVSTTFSASNLPPLAAFNLKVVARDAAGFSVSSTSFPVPNINALDASTLDDGIPDRWKLTHGLVPTDPAGAEADPDGDGKTNLAEFQAGTDPNDYYENLAPVIVLLTPVGGLGPDDSLSVKVTDSGGRPLVNAPVELTARDGERLIFDAAYPSVKSVTVRTNAQGVATVFVESAQK